MISAGLSGYEGSDVAALERELRRLLGARVRPSTAHLWAVFIAPEGVNVIPRAELVSRLVDAGLTGHARELATTRRPNAVPCWLESEAETELLWVPVPKSAPGRGRRP